MQHCLLRNCPEWFWMERNISVKIGRTFEQNLQVGVFHVVVMARVECFYFIGWSEMELTTMISTIG